MTIIELDDKIAKVSAEVSKKIKALEENVIGLINLGSANLIPTDEIFSLRDMVVHTADCLEASGNILQAWQLHHDISGLLYTTFSGEEGQFTPFFDYLTIFDAFAKRVAFSGPSPEPDAVWEPYVYLQKNEEGHITQIGIDVGNGFALHILEPTEPHLFTEAMVAQEVDEYIAWWNTTPGSNVTNF